VEHDQRFKTLIRHFFADFLRLFFADWAARFDLSHIEWLDKELLPNPPDRPVHILDMVARLPVNEPVDDVQRTAPWLVLVHIEIESPDHTTRMKPRLYYYHLRAAHQLPVLPIVIYLNVHLDGIGIDVCNEKFWDLEVVTFRYLYVGLPGLDGVKYVAGDNWLGVALAALMKVTPDRVAWLGAEALRRLIAAPLPAHERFLLGECVEAYLELDQKQLAEYQEILQKESYAEVRSMNKTTFEKGLEKGLEEGLEKGRLRGQRELTILLLEQYFGPVSIKLREHVESLNVDELKQLHLRIKKAESLAEAGLAAFVES
jgi:hypothetical protein